MEYKIRVPTKAEAKFRNEAIIIKLKQEKKKVKGRRKPKKLKNNTDSNDIFNIGQDTEECKEIFSKNEAVFRKDGLIGNSSETECDTSRTGVAISFAKVVSSSEESLRTNRDDINEYDTEKLGSELWSTLQGQELNLNNLTSDQLQAVVKDFSLKHKLDVEKVNVMLKDYVENKKKMLDGMMNHLLRQSILKNLESIDGKNLEEDTQGNLEICESIGEDQNNEQCITDRTGALEESDSLNEDIAIPVIRPRSPVILFEEDLALDSIIDKERERISKKKTLSLVDLSEQDKDGDTYLHIAVVKNHGSLPLLIESMQGDTLNIPNRMGHTPLHLAVILRNENIVKKLVYHGSSLAVVDYNGNTPLHLSCQTDDYILNMNLVYKSTSIPSCGLKAALATRNYEGEAPLHIAMSRSYQSGDDKIVRLLLGLKCNINIVHGKTGKSSLFMALENQQYELARFLIKNGADPSLGAFSGTCPLHLAAQAGHVMLVKELIAENACIYAKTSDSETAKDLASNDEIKQILEKAMKKERRNRQKKKSNKQAKTSF